MSFEEKVTWVSGMVAVLVAGVYTWTVGSQLGQQPVAEIAYQRLLLMAAGGMIVLTIVGAIATAIGSAILAELSGTGSADNIDRSDERDALIDARGDRVAFYVLSALMIGVLAMAMLEVEHFWIANGTFVAFVLAGLVSTGVKLVAYRRGW